MTLTDSPYKFLPFGTYIFDGEICDDCTGERIQTPTTCQCDEGHLCFLPACQERQAAFEAEYAWMGHVPRTERLTDEEARDIWSHRPGKAESYLASMHA